MLQVESKSRDSATSPSSGTGKCSGPGSIKDVARSSSFDGSGHLGGSVLWRKEGGMVIWYLDVKVLLRVDDGYCNQQVDIDKDR